MKNFKGFQNWVEIFRGGKQVDGNGVEHDGDALIESALTTFDPEEHEPPLVVGHPTDNQPAFGWVAALKKEFQNGVWVLLAKFKNVIPEFENLVRKGAYKKRSASFYGDGRLRHVGFLGAAPPAIKGLADLKFQAANEAIFTFEDRIAAGKKPFFRKRFHRIHLNTDKEDLSNMELKDFKDWFLEAFKLGRDSTQTESEMLQTEEALTFSEAEYEAAKNKAVEAEKRLAALRAEFAEREKRSRDFARKEKISEWIEKKVKDGKILPAWVKSGIKEFMVELDSEVVHEFSEGKLVTGLDWFKNFVENELPKFVVFNEIAVWQPSQNAGDPADMLQRLTAKKMQENPEMGYPAAFALIQQEYPEIVSEYYRQIGVDS